MECKIIADSSCELTAEMKKSMGIEIVPLTLRLEDKEYIDDDRLDVLQYIKDMKECKTPPKTSCPSPAAFLNKFETDKSIFVVTLSSKISGTYQSAVTAKNIFTEKSKNYIHVFDSMSASVGETLTCMKINELAKRGMNEDEITRNVNEYISSMKTYFLLENLEHLAKSGRISHLIAKVASVLDLKLIMGSNGEGGIRLVEKVRGYRKAFNRFLDACSESGVKLEEKILGIAHCNCPDRALKFKEEVKKRYNFKDIIIVEMSGLTSSYADEGGMVIAF
ncbi:MAG TPA: DegV family protein [Clostridiaceae bacterium]|nr:DegV family protein [Clostridiaceae bacterium]